jgi:hypothetical protein
MAALPVTPVTAGNLDAFVSEVKIVEEPYYDSYKVCFLATPPAPFDSSDQELGVAVAVSKQLWQDNYLPAMEEVRFRAAKEFNSFFALNGMPAWVRERLDLWYATEGKPVPTTLKTAAEKYIAAAKAYSPAESVTGHRVMNDLGRSIPGIYELVTCPVKDCKWRQDRIVNMVQHLNDGSHSWTREQIADWLESLDVDLTFPAEPPPPQPKLPQADPDKVLFIIATTYETARREAARRGRANQDWIFVPISGNHINKLRGYRDIQFTCVHIAYAALPEQVRDQLMYMNARQVGEEHYPYAKTTDDLFKAAYEPLLKQQVEDLSYWQEMFIKKACAPTHIVSPQMWEFVKAEAYTPSLGEWVAAKFVKYIDESIFKGAVTFSFDPSTIKPPEVELEENAQKLLNNLKALEGSGCEDTTLWLADPTLLGEALPEEKKDSTTPTKVWESDAPKYEKFLNNPTKSKKKKK